MTDADESLAMVEGVLDRIVYENTASGFFVGRVREENAAELTTVVGNLMAISPGEQIRFWGRWVEDPKWGRQLRIERYETVVPSTSVGIEKYLGSGLIPGIGPKYAKRLVTLFGTETLNVIEKQPERLRKVPGLGKNRIQQIRESWQKHRAIQSIMIFLQSHGISPAQATRIYKQYGDGAAAVLRENPYRLATDISGIGFKNADKIAHNLGIALDSPYRAEAGLLYALEQATLEGHVYLPEAELMESAAQLLSLDKQLLVTPLTNMIRGRRLIQSGDTIYTKLLFCAELGCERLLKILLSTPPKSIDIKIDKAVAWAERTNAIAFAEEQREAIRTAVAAKAMVITGGPGTGKTTLVKSLVSIFAKKDLHIALAAPTGRAAKRLESATGVEARTLHRLLEFSPKHGGFTRDETNPLSADVIVVDETSMVDIFLLHNLLKAMPRHARLIFVGDVDQLPSVGPGNVLMDLISSNMLPVVWLKTVFRQAEQSGIVRNAHRINKGEYPEFNTTDFFFVERKDPAKAVETIVELVTKRIPPKFNLDPVRDIQVLAPMHRGEAGITRLNEALQEALNPGGERIAQRLFRRGDKVMQMRNNYELDVYNGDVGIVTLLDSEAGELEITYDDRVVLYPLSELDDVVPAYAATIHKSQGSEYPAVIVLIHTQHYKLLQRNLLYTAITRGKRLVLVVGSSRALAIAIKANQVRERRTTLKGRLRA